MIKLISFMLGVIILSISLLVWYTSQGSTAAAMTLGGLIALILLTIGYALSQSSIWFNHRRNQQDFMDNARENMQIMATMQRVQNAQNQQLLKQAKEMPKLASGEDNVFDVNDYVDLDNVEIEGL